MTRLPLVFLVVVAGCDFSAVKDFGEPCDTSEACGDEGECVIVDDDVAHCLPRPPGRGERACEVDAGCTVSDGELWPLEAECLDGQCRCLGSDIFCAQDGEEELVLQEETCRCIPRGTEGDTCITSHTCGRGLACTDGECRSAAQQEGSACEDSADCGQFTCAEKRDNNDVGVCR